MNWGYCRVSTIEQDLSVQEEWLKSKGIDKTHVFEEKVSGKSKDNRKQLERLLDSVETGDVVYVYKLDRLSRSTKDSLDIISFLREKNVSLEFNDLGRVENNKVGDMIFTIFSAVAQMERRTIVERTQSGKRYQKEHNPDFHEGRPKKLTDNQVKQLVLRSDTESITELASSYNVSRATVYNYLRKYRNEDLKTN